MTKGRATPRAPRQNADRGRRPGIKATKPAHTSRPKKARNRRKAAGRRRWFV